MGDTRTHTEFFYISPMAEVPLQHIQDKGDAVRPKGDRFLGKQGMCVTAGGTKHPSYPDPFYILPTVPIWQDQISTIRFPWNKTPLRSADRALQRGNVHMLLLIAESLYPCNFSTFELVKLLQQSYHNNDGARSLIAYLDSSPDVFPRAVRERDPVRP
jgi:hypothetical protein